MARLLVIDDDATVRATLGRVLRLAGHEIVEAEDGRSGLATLAAIQVDAVITDVLMPGIDGIELAERIKATDPHLPIVVISGSDAAWAAAQTFGWTGSSTLSPLTRARSVGVEATIGKPFETRELLETVERVLAAAQRPSTQRTMRTFHVRPDPHGGGHGWRIQRDGNAAPAARIGDREEAVFLAKRLAGAHRSSRVIVYAQDSTIEVVYHYGSDGTERLA
jgi:CheY-like chemotaxis protein